MTEPRLLSEVADADWVGARLRPPPHAWGRVDSVVPTGFDVVVRVFHPAGDRTWAQVAAATGRTMHPLAQWCGIEPHFTGGRTGDLDPEEGSVPRGTLEAILDHCPAEGEVTYAVWAGFGSWQLAAEPPTVRVGRECYLFAAPKAPLVSWPGMVATWEQSANVIWPADRSWCIATEIDWDSTLVAGSRTVADAILGDPRLEAYEVGYEDDLSWLGDTVNPRPGWLPLPD